MSAAERVTEEVRALAGLDLEGLRTEWRRRYGAPPKLRSVELLGLLLAWNIQASTLGGLSSDTARRLRRGVGLAKPRMDLSPGTRLKREWNGVAHEVEVNAEGYRYAGVTYRSLSKIAGVITGVKWNGRRFFGLERKSAA